MIDGNIEKFKSGIAFLLTTRGTPSLFYGTEILMKAWSNPDAKVRLDFPGGWEKDSVNKFTSSGRNQQENEAFNYIKKLAHYRKKCEAITNGNLTQFVPENGIYVYFRTIEKQKVMVIMNTNNKEITLETARYKEIIAQSNYGIDIMSDVNMSNIQQINLKPNQTLVVELFEN
jgi:glycosidase